jgi:hypothetical protein
MEDEGTNALDTLRKLRQGALLLSVANAYLSEPPFLKKIGREMILALGRVPGEVESIRRQFPGRFEKEVDFDPLLKDLSNRLESVRNPGEDQLASSRGGDLGRELELAVGRLTAAVLELKERVEGTSALKAATSRTLRRPTLDLPRAIMRALLLLVVLAAALFDTLFLTMEREGGVLEEIAAIEARAQSSRLLLSAVAKEKENALRALGSIKAGELSRPEKIEFLEWSQKLLQISERQRETEAELIMLEEKIRSQRARLDEMRKKPFWMRLLRM